MAFCLVPLLSSGSYGETLVQLLYEAASGNTAAVKDTDTGCQWYTAENCGDAEIAQNLYE